MKLLNEKRQEILKTQKTILAKFSNNILIHKYDDKLKVLSHTEGDDSPVT
jgi:hypothetical protein